MKKKMLFLILTAYCTAHITFTDDSNSWFSPSYYKNAISNSSVGWSMKQLAAMYNKMSEAQKIEQKWKKQYEKKGLQKLDDAFKGNATKDGIAFRDVLKDSAKKAQNGPFAKIMYPLINNPEKFLFGASSSSYQYEGGLDKNNASAVFYNDKGLPLAGNAIDFWHRYGDDIKQMKNELGINSFRISIAWDRVEPTQGNYDEKAIDTYVDIIKTLKSHGIEPIVVLHHYTIPQWFAEIGGFEKAENSVHFVNFAIKMYQALHADVTYWSTFNAIEGYAFKGYYQLDGPPGGDTKSFYKTELVMANMLNAHVEIYQAIKERYKNTYKNEKDHPEPQIGLQKNIAILDPLARETLLIRATSTIPSIIGEGLQNKGFFDFFTTGVFDVYVPEFTMYGRKRVYVENKQAPKSIDWIGINVYSNMEMYLGTKLIETDEDRKTANINYRDYPEGIYRATKIVFERLAKPLKLPIIITENGIATKDKHIFVTSAIDNDDLKRTRFFRRTLYIILRLIEKGYPIIGYTPCASHDNYEWPSKDQPEPFTSRRYGFFHVNFEDGSLKRTLKPGAYYYRDFIRSFFKDVNEPKANPPAQQTEQNNNDNKSMTDRSWKE
jgi:beta-glucosidase